MSQKDFPEDVLRHYGVLGMRWGVRKDRKTGVRKGTPTKGTSAAKRKASPDHTRARNISKKRVSQMSNKELRDYNERARLEQEYRRVTSRGRSRTAKSLQKASNIAIRVLYETNKKQADRVLRDAGHDRAADFIKKYGDTAVSMIFGSGQGGKKRK